MIPGGPTEKSASVFASIGACAIVIFLLPGDPILLEGSDGATESSLGNYFADHAQGIVSPEDAEELVEQPAPEDIIEQPEVTETEAQEAPEVEQPDPDQTERPDVTENTQAVPDQVEKPLLEENKQVDPTLLETEVTEREVEPEATVIAALPAPTPEALPLQPTEPQEVIETPTLQPLEPEEIEPVETVEEQPTAVARSLRPKPRTPEFEQKNKPKPEPKVVKKTPKKQPKKQAEVKKQKQKKAEEGTAAENSTTGKATGQNTTKAVASTGRGTKSQGNAAASNYPGKVMKKIQRVPKPRVSVKSKATVKFKIASSGALSGVSITKSSGSAEVDKIALRVIRRAAPFPPPPAGAQRVFRISIGGK